MPTFDPVGTFLFLVLLHSVGEVADCRRIVKGDSLLALPRWSKSLAHLLRGVRGPCLSAGGW